jgi:L-lactate dehydrogenase
MKIGIMGSGMVGSSSAFALIMAGVGGELVLVDKNQARAKAEADDLLHAVPFMHPRMVKAGGMPDLEACEVILYTAGVNQQPGESRLSLLQRNIEIVRLVLPQVFEIAPEAIFLIATNPVDILTHTIGEMAIQHGLDRRRVIGTGTTLDTARFRALLGEYLNVDARHVHAYVLGEHGDSEVMTWSTITIGGLPLDRFCELQDVKLDSSRRDEIEERVRKAAYHIIEGKGATYYGIGAAVTHIVDAIEHDHRSILTVSAHMDTVEDVENVTLSLPHMVGGEGIIKRLPIELNPEEHQALALSARTLRHVIEEAQG